MSKRVDRKQAARVVREQLARERRRRRAVRTSAVAAAVLLVACLAGYVAYRAQQPEAGFAAPASATADRTGVKVGDGPVTVEVYLDYLCPACRQFEADAASTIEKLVAERRITTVYYPVAILDRYSTNAYSSRSAAGAGCASDAGKLTEYTNALYADQPAEGGAGHTDDRLIEIASAAGLPGEAFGQCLREGRYAGWVTHVTSGMSKRGVNGTPTVFVGGRRLENPTALNLAAEVDKG